MVSTPLFYEMRILNLFEGRGYYPHFMALFELQLLKHRNQYLRKYCKSLKNKISQFLCLKPLMCLGDLIFFGKLAGNAKILFFVNLK